MRELSSRDLEEVVQGWQYWCPDRSCHNRTFNIDSESGPHQVSVSKNGEVKYLVVRVLNCDRCRAPLVIGTNRYHDKQKGWAARGDVMLRSDAMMAAAAIMSHGSPPRHAIEFIAFTEPIQEMDLPEGLPPKIVSSFREAEYGVAKNKPISAAAAIRNTVRLLVEDNKIAESNFKKAIKQLPFSSDYINALVNMKIMGDDTLHYEEYEIDEIRPAVEILQLALDDYYSNKARLKTLHKAVSNKASAKAKSAQDKTK